jgi:hypothetical protein
MNSMYIFGDFQYFTLGEKTRLRQLAVEQIRRIRSGEDVVILRLGWRRLEHIALHFLGYDRLDVQLVELKRPRTETVARLLPVVCRWPACTERRKTWSHAITYADGQGTFWCEDDRIGLCFLQVFGLDGSGRPIVEVEQEEHAWSEERAKELEQEFEKEFGVGVEVEVEAELEAVFEESVLEQEQLRQQYDVAVRARRTDLERSAGFDFYVIEQDGQQGKTWRRGPFLLGQAELTVLMLQTVAAHADRSYAIKPVAVEWQQAEAESTRNE